jgi:signal transduction histidine kinase
MRRRRPLPPTVRARMEAAEATLEAIRTGSVDALVISGPSGARTLAIEGATQPYHLLLDAMNDGAAIHDAAGTILFANRRLAEVARVPATRLPGTRFADLCIASERAVLGRMVTGPAAAGEFRLTGPGGVATPVWISVSFLPIGADPTGADSPVRMAIVTDLTERKRAEATRNELMKRLISVEDEERRRIARELHDETGQSLTALLVGLRAIEERTQLPELAADARRLRAIAAQTVDDIGRLSRGLHPSVLDDLGLHAAARRYVGDYIKSHGLAVEFNADGLEATPLPPLAQTTVYRILQEALTNVARHAEAKSVRVDIRSPHGWLELEVRDDGRGFDTEVALRDRTGLGLHGMGERVILLGGTLEITSVLGTGTTLFARISLVQGPVSHGVPA